MEQQLKDKSNANRLTTVLFIIYLIALYWILLLKLGVQFSYMSERRANLIPFHDTLIITGENILNVLIFVPLGIYAGELFKKWGLHTKLLLFFMISLIIEALQYILRAGAFDTTDIITNTLGGILGWIIYKGLEKAFPQSERRQNFINIIAATGTVVLILFLLLLKMGLLPVRYQ